MGVPEVFLTPILGAVTKIVWPTGSPGAIFRIPRLDDDGYLEVLATLVGVSDVNVAQFGGTAVVNGGINGLVGVGGGVADNSSISTLKPVVIGGRASAGEGPNVDEGDVAHISCTLARRLRTDVDLTRVGSQAIASAGLSGVQSVGGTQAEDGSAKDASFPVQVGAVVDETLADTFTDGRTANMRLDTYGRLWVRPEHIEPEVVTDANEDDVDAGTQYYPSSAGFQIGIFRRISVHVLITNGAFTVQARTSPGSWDDITKSFSDLNTGLSGYDSTHYTSIGDTAQRFLIELEKLGADYLRFTFTRNNATNKVQIYRKQT